VTAPGLMLCDDLIFFSRVAGAARAIGLSVRQERNSLDLLAAALRCPPGGIIVDLHNPGLDLPSFLRDLRLTCQTMPRVVAYGSHVEADVLRQARKAGCDRVLPRSQFVEELERDLASWLGKEENAQSQTAGQ
jgi:CheY-like chemotaxis protein